MLLAWRTRDGSKRRRERRLRSWLKHERQTVRMVLAETFHHSLSTVSAEVVGLEGTRLHAALRGPKTARTTEATHFKSSTKVARGAGALQP